MNILDDFIQRQRALWPMADKNFSALERVRTKTLHLGDFEVRVQFNPDRIISSNAKTDKASVSKRPCFLCPEHRFPEQIFLPVITPDAHTYDILLNPFPIFPRHLVIALSEHSDQGIAGRLKDLLFLARFFDGYTFFYNGPSSGASAPDHHHFQAAPQDLMPIEKLIKARQGRWEELARRGDARLYLHRGFYRGVFIINSGTEDEAAALFDGLMARLPMEKGEGEPRVNLVAFREGEGVTLVVIARRCHRSHHFYSTEADHLLMSPGCADMAGCFVTPMPEDFDKLDDALLAEMVDEITLPAALEQDIVRSYAREKEILRVGILTAPVIRFELPDGRIRTATLRDGQVACDGRLSPSLLFEAPDRREDGFLPPFFQLHDVVIGIGFHWEQKETQCFAGSLEIIVEGDALTAVNRIPVEDYLLSVISSEMSAAAPLEFLKAHAVISRSWVLNVKQGRTSQGCERWRADLPWEKDYEKWYGGGSHRLYDVCADDHCQRYQGLTRSGAALTAASVSAIAENVRRAVRETAGQVLTFRGDICDARFYKCCGGRTEVFSTAWEDEDKPYLLSKEDPYCREATPAVLSQVLNDYDEATRDWYDWEEVCPRDELSRRICEKSGYDIGTLQTIRLLEKGESGRWKRIALCGDRMSLIVGKELEIRRLLSASHLKSSAFTLEYLDGQGRSMALQTTEDGRLLTPWASLRLKGKGWGHGVGLCQIGAAVMAGKGFGYRQILDFYYPGSELK